VLERPSSIIDATEDNGEGQGSHTDKPAPNLLFRAKRGSIRSFISRKKENNTMPTVRKLAPEEVQVIENKGKGQRKLTEELYDSFLADYNVGEYGEAELDENEKRLTVRNRLKAAATRRGLGLQFNRTTGNIIRFMVVDGNGQAVEEPPPAPEPEPAPVVEAPPAKRRGGRPKKQTT
jgi:hypothetical protein